MGHKINKWSAVGRRRRENGALTLFSVHILSQHHLSRTLGSSNIYYMAMDHYWRAEQASKVETALESRGGTNEKTSARATKKGRTSESWFADLGKSISDKPHPHCEGRI